MNERHPDPAVLTKQDPWSEHYPRRLVVSTLRFLDLQYRAWEGDLLDPEQPLLEYGFRITPDKNGLSGRACRYDAFDGVSTIVLGNAVIHGRSGGAAVSIDRQTLRISTAYIHEWSPSARIIPGAPPQAGVLVQRLISWVGGYEQWVCDCWGEEQRAKLLASAGLDADFPSRWWKLASEWRRALSTP